MCDYRGNDHKTETSYRYPIYSGSHLMEQCQLSRKPFKNTFKYVLLIQQLLEPRIIIKQGVWVAPNKRLLKLSHFS